MKKALRFCGSALEDLKAFPPTARRQAGYQLDRIQSGQVPHDWKPLKVVGRGVRELRIRDARGAFRIVYVVMIADTVFVLHCFQKKTQKTRKTDLDVAAKRYKELVKELRR